MVISTNARFNDNKTCQEAGRPSSEKLARLLCLAWLRQVFHGRVFPVQFTADDVFLSDDGNVAFLGSAFSTTPTDIKDSIWKYLLALAADNPDECCRTLLSLMHKHKERVSSQELLASFRQAVTCFMSGPGKQDFYTGLAARVLRHLQLATEAGYHPLPALLAFYRGLFSALAIARALQPTGDPLLEAVEGVWVLGIFGSASQMIRIDSLSDISSKYAAAIFDFPTRLDAMLSQALRKKSDEAIEPATASAQDNTPAYSVAIVLLLTAVLLLVRNGPIHFSSAWIDGVSFVICCLIGLLVLRMAARS